MKKILSLFTRKFFSYLLTLYLLVTFVFFLVRITPGDPVTKYISPDLSSELADKVRASFHLNDSIAAQYSAFLKNVLTGDFGISYEYHQPVFQVIREYLPFTIIFALASFAIQFFLGISCAIYTVKKRKPALEKIMDGFALAVYSMPTFLLGVFLVYLFSVTLNILPSADLYSTSFAEKGLLEKIREIFTHSILPLITLSLPGIVIFYRYAKENILAALDKNYVRYLFSNGITEKEIYRKHILPNILPQLISLSVVELSILLSGTLITEVLFNLPGIGRITITAILQRDYPLIVASTLLSGVFVIICNFSGEAIRCYIDKRLLKEIYS